MALRCKPLLPQALAPGDVVELMANLSTLRFLVRVNRSKITEACRLPAPKRTRGAAFRSHDTPYYPFIALRGATEIELRGDHLSGQVQPKALSTPLPPPRAVCLSGPPGAGKTNWAMQHAEANSTARRVVHVLSAEWLHHRVALTAAIEGAGQETHSDASAELAAIKKMSIFPPALRRLLALDAELCAEDYWVTSQGCWDLDGIDDDLAITLFQAPASAQTLNCTDVVAQAPRQPYISGSRTWSLSQCRGQLVQLMSELLRRAARRGAAIVADDCHLQAARRAAMRIALLHYPGVVRWAVVLPRTSEELSRRQASRDEHLVAKERREGATLPGWHGDGMGLPVEFVEGSDLSVFDSWRGASRSEHLARSGSEQGGDRRTALSEILGAPCTDGSFLLSTEGSIRR